MDIVLGSVTLDSATYAPVATVSYEFFKTDSGEIIGGNIIARITGTVSVNDPPNGGSQTGAQVMKKLKTVRDLGKQTSCITTNIPNFNPLNNQAKITAVNIEQGPDPAWINQGAFSIEVRGLIDNIPPNSLGIVAADGVTRVTREELLNIEEQSHGGYNNNLEAQTFVRFTNRITLSCSPFCSNITPIAVLKKIARIGITNPIFSQYSSWTQYLQSRSLEIASDGSLSFSADIILLPPGSPAALVNLEFSYKRTYESKDITYVTTGSVEGLVSLNWSNIVDLDSSCSSSKIANAQSAYDQLSSKYQDLSQWAGETLELTEKPDCPKATTTSIGQCRQSPDADSDKDSDCIKPSSSAVNIDRTGGIISFTYEWSTTKDSDQKTCVINGIRRETTVDITEPQQNYAEHYIPGYGTLIQNLNCRSAKRISVTFSETYPDKSCATIDPCVINEGKRVFVDRYLKDPKSWIMIGNIITRTINSYTEKVDYIFCRGLA